MDSIQFIPADDGFTLLVRPAGWASQAILLIVTAVAFALGAAFTHAVFHGFKVNGRPGTPFDSIYATPLWAIGLAALAAALQGARRQVVFIANPQFFVIATAGPLRKTTREFPRASLLAALVGDSTTSVNGSPLQQLKLYFVDRSAPLTMFTGRDTTDLRRIARYLTDALALSGNSYSSTQFMEIRHAPLHLTTFKLICGTGVALGLIDFSCSRFIGIPAVAIIFFGIVITALIVISVVLKKAQCPNCSALITRDNISADGYMQYTCPTCRIVWQSPIKVGGPRH